MNKMRALLSLSVKDCKGVCRGLWSPGKWMGQSCCLPVVQMAPVNLRNGGGELGVSLIKSFRGSDSAYNSGFSVT